MPNSIGQFQELRVTATTSQRQILLTQLIGITTDAELEELVNRELEENPALDLKDEPSPEDDMIPDDYNKEEEPSSENDWDNEAKLQDTTPEVDAVFYDQDADTWEPKNYQRQNSDDAPDFERTLSYKDSWMDLLYHQIDDMFLTEQQRFLAKYLVGYLDHYGYLTENLSSIASSLFLYEDVRTDAEELKEIVVNVIQRLEPAGIGAASLQECLILQIKQKLEQEKDNVLYEEVLCVLQEHFALFSAKNYAEIRKKMCISDEKWQQIHNVIRQLSPHPISIFKDDEYIIPDCAIFCDDNGKLSFSLINEYHPRLRISPEYEDMKRTYAAMRKKKRDLKEKQSLANKEITDAENYVKGKIASAQTFIDALSDREKTLQLIIAEILKQQHDYFVTGDVTKIRPMVLRNVAEKVGMDISTISRATSQRYAQTPFGIIPLKSLFSEALNKEDGISSITVKEKLKELIQNEDKKKPFSDEKLAELLTKSGIKIARRTVAQYRENLGIATKAQRAQE